jgi:hypothetical protein
VFKESHENMDGGGGGGDDDERSGCPRSHRTNEKCEKVQNLVHSNRCLSITAMAVQLNFGTHGPITVDCQAVSGPKIDYWDGKPTLFPSFGSK